MSGGTAYYDNCSTCVGGNTGEEQCVADCNGVFGGTASMDDCGVCSGGNTGLEPNASCTDYEGVVNGTVYPGTICYKPEFDYSSGSRPPVNSEFQLRMTK